MATSDSLEPAVSVLKDIERELDFGSYKPGRWQTFLRETWNLGEPAKKMLSKDMSRVSNKLHRRNGFQEIPATMGIFLELMVLSAGLIALTSDNLAITLFAVALLAASLQPTIKILAGYLVGVRYAYAYLWYIEPRFKMQYGTYFSLSAWRKVIFQLAGSIGTPIAFLLGWLALDDEPFFAIACFIAFLAAAGMQIAAFVAVWNGVNKAGPFTLTNLTTPAVLARELKSALG